MASYAESRERPKEDAQKRDMETDMPHRVCTYRFRGEHRIHAGWSSVSSVRGKAGGRAGQVCAMWNRPKGALMHRISLV